MAALLARCRVSSLVFALALSLALAAPAAAQRNNVSEVVVAPIGEAAAGDITQAGLEDAVRRFADRFYSSVTQITNQIRSVEDQDQRTRLLMHNWKTVSAETIVELAIGANSVTSLLDMMVLTRLSRLMVEGYWAPTILTPEEGQAMSATYARLEADIWEIGADVLTPEQLDTLVSLIDDWYRDNSDQIYPWYIRLNEFSDQRAVALQNLQRSDSLFGIREARESVEELQVFGERLLYYLQRAPALLSYQLEASVYEVLAAEEVMSLIEDADQFEASVEQLVAVIAEIPSSRLEAIDQLVELLGNERRAFMTDLRNTSAETGGSLEEARFALEAFERILRLLRLDQPPRPGSRPFDITEYEAVATEAGAAAQEFTAVLDAFETLLSAPVWDNSDARADAVIEQVVAGQAQLIDRLFLYGILLILTFFACLIVYRLLVTRVFRITPA